MSSIDAKLERIKTVATIFSSVAVPIVITLASYFIQQQLSTEGLKKDYVGIAAGILKENPANQDADLRAWAVAVLDENAPLPLSKRAKESLRTGVPVVVPGPAWLGPPKDCRIPPKKRDLSSRLEKLLVDIKGAEAPRALVLMGEFVDYVVRGEAAVSVDRARLECLQSWVKSEEDLDIAYRLRIGAPSSKSVYEEIAKEKSAQAASAVSGTR